MWNCDAQFGRFLAGEDAGAIREVSDETQRRNPNFRTVGYALPLDILAERDLSAGGAGSQFVSPSLTLGKVSDGLRDLDPLLKLGVDIQEIQHLGNVAVPLEQAVTDWRMAKRERQSKHATEHTELLNCDVDELPSLHRSV